MGRKLLPFLILGAILIWAAVLVLPDRNVHVYICDVGQGDGILIVHQHLQILVDVGPSAAMADCLGRHMPFYDRTIELVIITHPQQDHMGGLTNIAERYIVNYLVSVPAANPIKVYDWLQDEWQAGLPVANVYSGDAITMGEVSFEVIWPTREFVQAHTSKSTQVLGVSTDGTDLNAFAIVGILSFGEFDFLLTGDADRPIEPAQIATGLLRQVEVLKVPHHGSKTGFTSALLEVVKPQLAVISVGRNNRYGHPSPEILDLLSSFKIQTLRTDLVGDIEIVSNGQTYWLE